MENITRRTFMEQAGLAAAAVATAGLPGRCDAAGADSPNFILCMSDNQGWGDVAYNGHPYVKTPVLDEMAATGLRFDRFYASFPICSPTRGSFLTGRFPSRFGCHNYGYSLRPEELTIAEVLQAAGYATGHFGKWHVGPVKAESTISPGASGFDEYVSHDNYYDNNPSLSRNGQDPEDFIGEGSEVTVNETLKFVQRNIDQQKPFLAVVWFGAPHQPYEALPEDKSLYDGLGLKDEHQHRLGEITAMDRAIGVLRDQLRELGVADNTLLWFCGDNGAEAPGSTTPLEGSISSLWEAGIRVPGVLEWPGGLSAPRATSVPCSTMDIFHAVVDIAGAEIENPITPVDGISLKNLFNGTMTKRPSPIPFWWRGAWGYDYRQGNDSWFDDQSMLRGWWRPFQNWKHPVAKTGDFLGEAALIDDTYKLYKSKDGEFMLYDLEANSSGEGKEFDVSEEHPEIVQSMKEQLEAWQVSVEQSCTGADYTGATPVVRRKVPAARAPKPVRRGRGTFSVDGRLRRHDQRDAAQVYLKKGTKRRVRF